MTFSNPISNIFKQLIISFFVLTCYKNIKAQNTYTCFAVAAENGTSNNLFAYNQSDNAWTNIGITGTNNIKAIAIDSNNDIIYASENGTIGTINKSTANFTTIGNVGFANGSMGLIEINDIKGLTFDNDSEILWASHRVSGSGASTNDLLIQIDPATGNFIAEAFNGNDYAIIEEVFEGTLSAAIYDVDDIAINPLTGNLFAMHIVDEFGILTVISKFDGEVEQIVFSVTNEEIEGIAFDSSGQLFATTGNNTTGTNPNSFLNINYNNQNISTIGLIDPTGASLDFEAVDCYSLQLENCTADAATLTSQFETIILAENSDTTICANLVNNPTIPADYQITHFLSNSQDLNILDENATTCFQISDFGSYTIHTLVYNPSSFNLFNLGTSPSLYDINALLIQGGGFTCGSLDLIGTRINVVDLNTSNKPTFEQLNIKVFPIPSNNKFNINFGNHKASSLKIYDTDGKIIKSYQNNLQQLKSFDLSNYSKGIYLLSLQIENEIYKQKIVMQ